MHYRRWLNNGDPQVARLTYDVGERLEKYGEPQGECLVWTKKTDNWGYGVTSLEGRSYRVHRLVWERANGPIPEGMLICHTCDNPPCYFLKHLFLGTHQDNMRDMAAKGRSVRGRRRMYPHGPYLPRETVSA